jgi:type II secretory pathway predicted ATPase ExeA
MDPLLDYWQLRRNPFAPPAVDGEMFLAGRCEEALARLLFVVEQGRRLAAVTGGPNIGKSRLLREVRETSDLLRTHAVSVDVTSLSRPGFAIELAQACGCPARSEQAAWERITDLLHGWRAIGLASLWLIDQLDDAGEPLDRDVLRLVRLLERTEAKGTVLLGARALHDHSGWLDVLDLSVSLEPWCVAECREFIEQRLEAAGACRTVFSQEGLDAIAEASDGVPGALIRMCDLSLRAGWSLGVNVIDAGLVESIAAELSPVPSPAAMRERMVTS